MIPTLTDVMRAADDLEVIYHKVFESFEPLWDADQQMMRRALAILHAAIKHRKETSYE